MRRRVPTLRVAAATAATVAALGLGALLPAVAVAAPAHGCTPASADVLTMPDRVDDLGAAPCAGAVGSAATHSEAIVAGTGLVVLGTGAALYRRRRRPLTPA